MGRYRGPCGGQCQAAFSEQPEQRAAGVAEHPEDQVVVTRYRVPEVTGFLLGECHCHAIFSRESFHHGS
jgi:hypothetical protein